MKYDVISPSNLSKRALDLPTKYLSAAAQTSSLTQSVESSETKQTQSISWKSHKWIPSVHLIVVEEQTRRNQNPPPPPRSVASAPHVCLGHEVNLEVWLSDSVRQSVSGLSAWRQGGKIERGPLPTGSTAGKANKLVQQVSNLFWIKLFELCWQICLN